MRRRTLGRKRFLLSLVTIAMVLGAGTVAAGGRHGGSGEGSPGLGDPGGPGPRRLRAFLGRLDLATEQRGQIRNLLREERDSLFPLVDRAREARRQLFAAIHLGPFEESKVRDASALLASAESDIAVARARIFRGVLDVLTPGQRVEATESLERLHGRHDGIGPRPGRR